MRITARTSQVVVRSPKPISLPQPREPAVRPAWRSLDRSRTPPPPLNPTHIPHRHWSPRPREMRTKPNSHSEGLGAAVIYRPSSLRPREITSDRPFPIYFSRRMSSAAVISPIDLRTISVPTFVGLSFFLTIVTYRIFFYTLEVNIFPSAPWLACHQQHFRYTYGSIPANEIDAMGQTIRRCSKIVLNQVIIFR